MALYGLMDLGVRICSVTYISPRCGIKMLMISVSYGVATPFIIFVQTTTFILNTPMLECHISSFNFTQCRLQIYCPLNMFYDRTCIFCVYQTVFSALPGSGCAAEVPWTW